MTYYETDFPKAYKHLLIQSKDLQRDIDQVE